MKSILRLSLVLPVLCAAPLLLRAQGDDMAARRTQAEALLAAMHTEQILSKAAGNVHQMVDTYSKQSAGTQTNLTPEQQAAMKKAQDEAHTLVNTDLGWDAVKNDFVQDYADAFTAEELKGLVAFYNSPLGQTLVEKQPVVTEKMGRLTQQKLRAAMPSIMQKIREGAPKPSPTASPSPTAATGVPLVIPAPTAAPAATAPALSPVH